MKLTIKSILERLNNGGYLGYGGVDQALKEIQIILDGAKPKELTGDNAMLEWGWIDYESKAHNMGINEYQENLKNVIGK